MTVSSVSRVRSAPCRNGNSPTVISSEDFSKNTGRPSEKKMVNHSKFIYDLKTKNEKEIDAVDKSFQLELINHRVRDDDGLIFNDYILLENDYKRERKKEKKWSLGGFFRRKYKKDTDESSEESEIEGKKGFLLRRKSKRDGRRLGRSRSTANGFDVVVPQQKEPSEQRSTDEGDKTALPFNGGSQKMSRTHSQKSEAAGETREPVRFIYRRHDAVSGGESRWQSKDSLKLTKKLSRKDYGISRSNSVGGGENVDGRKGRKKIMARAEAKRDMIRDESSSEQDDSCHSNSSLNRPSGDPIGPKRIFLSNRCRKARSKNEDCVSIEHEENEFGNFKSDFEGNCNSSLKSGWISRTYCRDAGDRESKKPNLIGDSRSPSSLQKESLCRGSHIPNSFPPGTFPPGTHCGQTSRNTSSTSVSVPTTSRSIRAKENRFPDFPFEICNYTPAGIDQYSERAPELPRSCSAMENSVNKKSFLDRGGLVSSSEKSLSCDQNIHKLLYSGNEMYGQRQSYIADHLRISPAYPLNPKVKEPSRMKGDSLKKARVTNMCVAQNWSKTFDKKNEMDENRMDFTPSLSSTPGNFPQPPTQSVQRSASGNPLCDSYECLKNFNQSRSNSYQYIPPLTNRSNRDFEGSALDYALAGILQRRSPPQKNKEKMKKTSLNAVGVAGRGNLSSANIPKSQVEQVGSSEGIHSTVNTSVLRYYADQNPRSRNPIHITCNSTSVVEQSYLSDSAIEKNSFKNSVTNALGFWKRNHREGLLTDDKLLKKSETAPQPLPLHKKAKAQMPPSDSLRLKSSKKALSVSDCNSNQEGGFCRDARSLENRTPEISHRDHVIGLNNALPRQEVLTRLPRCDRFSDQQQHPKKVEGKAYGGNLDDALNELEIIYNSLKLKDEDLADRAERRDLPLFTPGQFSKIKYGNAPNTSDKSEKVEREKDLKRDVLPDARSQIGQNGEHERAVPLRRSGVPDKVGDDMAFRRLNSTNRADAKKLPWQCYLRTGPSSASPASEGSLNSRKETCLTEPDVTYDDVVFRNIRHANSTLKIQDPQPPFGIPIGVISQSANSDYLHATPKERFRPTFTSSKTPDIVKDDLAFRNLRKDNKMVRALPNDLEKSYCNAASKKRVVRSFSANIFNVMQRERAACSEDVTRNPTAESAREKTQSLTDLSSENCQEKQVLEKKLKQLKKENNAKRTGLTPSSPPLGFATKSAEDTVTSSRWKEFSRTRERVNNVEADRVENNQKSEPTGKRKLQGSHRSDQSGRDVEKKSVRSPVVELSKYPAAAPLSTLRGNPFREMTVDSSVDDVQIDDLFTALAFEAKNASKDLEKQLDRLEGKKLPKANTCESDSVSKEKSTIIAVNEFNRKFKTSSTDKNKRRRNLSLSDVNETIEEVGRTSSLDRRPRKKQSGLLAEDGEFSHCRKGRPNAAEATDDSETTSQIIINSNCLPITDGTVCIGKKDPSIVPERGGGPLHRLTTEGLGRCRNSPFEAVSDLSQILQEVEVEQHLNDEIYKGEERRGEDSSNNDIFQRVYEYNCSVLNTGKRRSIGGNEETSNAEKVSVNSTGGFVSDVGEPTPAKMEDESVSDLEREFEKLHSEVGSDTKESANLALVDELIGDVTSNFGQSKSESGLGFPFPNDVCSPSWSPEGRERGHENGMPTCFGKGEGEVEKFSLDANLWLACSCALAFAFHLQEIDVMTALGIILAVVSVLAIFIL